MTAVIPLNNELVSEERDFACETTWKVVISRRFVVLMTTDRMKCCSYWERRWRKRILNHCTRLLYVWFPLGNYLIFCFTHDCQVSDFALGNPLNLPLAHVHNIPVCKQWEVTSVCFSADVLVPFFRNDATKTHTRMWDVKARFNRSVWEGGCTLLVLNFFKRRSHRCSTIVSRRTACLTEELCFPRLHFRSTERVMDRIRVYPK